MKRCRECIHIEVCLNHHGFMSVSGMESWIGQDCSFFEDESQFIKLSYKIGDVFYEPKRHQITEYQITRIVLNEFGLHYEVILKKGLLFRSIITSYDIGKIVFDTREEAEQALRSVRTMPTELTPREAIIKLNRIRTGKGERPPEIDMAITAINRQFIKRKTAIGGLNGRCCSSCGSQLIDEYCGHCGQALDWTD